MDITDKRLAGLMPINKDLKIVEGTTKPTCCKCLEDNKNLLTWMAGTYYYCRLCLDMLGMKSFIDRDIKEPETFLYFKRSE